MDYDYYSAEYDYEPEFYTPEPDYNELIQGGIDPLEVEYGELTQQMSLYDLGMAIAFLSEKESLDNTLNRYVDGGSFGLSLTNLIQAMRKAVNLKKKYIKKRVKRASFRVPIARPAHTSYRRASSRSYRSPRRACHAVASSPGGGGGSSGDPDLPEPPKRQTALPHSLLTLLPESGRNRNSPPWCSYTPGCCSMVSFPARGWAA